MRFLFNKGYVGRGPFPGGYQSKLDAAFKNIVGKKKPRKLKKSGGKKVGKKLRKRPSVNGEKKIGSKRRRK